MTRAADGEPRDRGELSNAPTCDCDTCAAVWCGLELTVLSTEGVVDPIEGERLAGELLLRSSTPVDAPVYIKPLSARNASGGVLAGPEAHGVAIYVSREDAGEWGCVYADAIAADRLRLDGDGRLSGMGADAADLRRDSNDGRGVAIFTSPEEATRSIAKVVLVDESGLAVGAMTFRVTANGPPLARGPLRHVRDVDLPRSATKSSHVWMNDDNGWTGLMISDGEAGREFLLAAHIEFLNDRDEIVTTGIAIGQWSSPGFGASRSIRIVRDETVPPEQWTSIVSARMRSSCALAVACPVSRDMESLMWWTGDVRLEVEHSGGGR